MNYQSGDFVRIITGKRSGDIAKIVDVEKIGEVTWVICEVPVPIQQISCDRNLVKSRCTVPYFGKTIQGGWELKGESF